MRDTATKESAPPFQSQLVSVPCDISWRSEVGKEPLFFLMLLHQRLLNPMMGYVNLIDHQQQERIGIVLYVR